MTAPADGAVAATDAASSAMGDGPASTVSVDPAASAVPGALTVPAEATATAPVAPTATPTAAVGPLQLKASAASWVEVVDGESRVLVSRVLLSGEVLMLNGTVPFKLTIGNAVATEVAFQGQAVNLAASTLANVARLELK